MKNLSKRHINHFTFICSPPFTKNFVLCNIVSVTNWITLEECQSGWLERSWKPSYVRAYRGFESHLLLHLKSPNHKGFGLFLLSTMSILCPLSILNYSVFFCCIFLSVLVGSETVKQSCWTRFSILPIRCVHYILVRPWNKFRVTDCRSFCLWNLYFEL